MKKALTILGILLVVSCTLSAKKSNNNSKQVEQNSETEYISDDNYSVEVFQKILQQLQIKSDKCYLPFVVEKYFNGLSCWVVPITTSMEAEKPYVFSLACYILFVDGQTGKIVNKYYDPHAWNSSDMRRLTKISIEDKPYQSENSIEVSISSDNNLNQSNDNAMKIFSVIAHYENRNDVSPTSSEEISLFIPQDKSLKKIFDYTTKIYGKNNCNDYDTIEKNLFISVNTTNGLYDMVMVIDSIVAWFSDDLPDRPFFHFTTDYKFFHYTGSKYEETTILNNTVVHIKRFFYLAPASPLGVEIYYCFGKTLAQAYHIWRGDTEYYLSELPKENISYSIASEGYPDIEIDYTYKKDVLNIYIYDGHAGESVKIIELDGYTLVSSSWSD